jgi:hypothetical protein
MILNIGIVFNEIFPSNSNMPTESRAKKYRKSFPTAKGSKGNLFSSSFRTHLNFVRNITISLLVGLTALSEIVGGRLRRKKIVREITNGERKLSK